MVIALPLASHAHKPTSHRPLMMLLCLLAMGTLHVSGQPDVDGSGTFLALQAPVGFPAIHLVGLANWGAFSSAGDNCPPGFNLTSDRLAKGPIYQQTLAQAMDAVCKLSPYSSDGDVAGCDSFLNLGDSFLDCGMNDPSRFQTDWASIYRNTKKTPTISKIPWYGIFGDRDTVSSAAGAPSIDIMRGFTLENPDAWITPFRYWAANQVVYINRSTPFAVTYISINTNPFVTEYSDPKSPYYNNEIAITSTPASISAQLDYIESKLSEKPQPDWLAIIGHHSLVGAAKHQRGLPSTANLGPGGTNDPGMPDLNGVPAFQRLFDMIREYKVDVYISGHDEALSLAVDPEDPATYQTVFVNSGAGSYPVLMDSCGYTRDYVKYVNADSIRGDCSKGVTGRGHLGFMELAIDGISTGAHVQLWTLPSNHVPSAFNAYTVDLPFKRGLR